MSTEHRTRTGSNPTTGEKGTGPLQQTTPRAQRPANSPETAPPSIHQTVVPDSSKPSHIPRKFAPSEINTALVHFYRGEVTRANTWRNRLDTTTNWAVLTAGATLSFAFSSPTNPHFVILINTVLVAFFLFMEARRYRYYEIWSSRVRVLETGYFARILSPDAPMDDAWARQLTDDLAEPHFTISEWEAVGRRLRRNYLWLFALLAAAWNLKVYLHPLPAYDFYAFIDRARVGVVPGEVVFMVGILFNTTVAIFAAATVRLKEATGEVLPQHDFSFRRMTSLARNAAKAPSTNAARRRAKRARERTRAAPRPGQTTGEWKRSDIHTTQYPEREPETTLK